MIRISEYARIEVPQTWKGRNPVRYVTLDEIGIDPSQIVFQPIPVVEDEGRGADNEPDPAVTIGSDSPAKVRFLTIPEAKEGLAATLGVGIDKIEITIKA